MLVGGVTWSTQYFFNQPFALSVGFSEIEMGWLFGTIRLINSVIIFKLTSLNKVLTKKRAFIGFPLLMILCYLPGYWVTKTSAVLLLAGATFASSARFDILGQYTNDEFNSKNRATALSSLNMLVSFLYILFMIGFGPVMENYSTQMVYTILGVMSLVLVLPLGVNLARKH